MSWIIGLLVAACLVKDKRWRNGLLIAAAVMLLVFSDKPLLQWVQYQQSKDYATQTVPERHYPVAIILGGFGVMNSDNGQMGYIEDRGSRLWEPYRLYRMGIVDKLLISGDAVVRKSKVEAFSKYMQEAGLPDSCLLVEQKARNTRENALYSISMLDSLGYTAEDCLLVTSATHMKRSLNCFATEGWELDAFAVNIYPKPEPTPNDFVPKWKTITDWFEVINEWVGNAVYKVIGY